MECLKKSAAAVSCLCNLGPYLLAIVAFRSVSTNMNKLPPRFIGQVMIQQEHLGPPQSQAVIPQLGQATLYHSLLWNANREHDRILLEGLRRNGVLDFPLPVSPFCNWGTEHGNRALPRVMQEML